MFLFEIAGDRCVMSLEVWETDVRSKLRTSAFGFYIEPGDEHMVYATRRGERRIRDETSLVMVSLKLC